MSKIAHILGGWSVNIGNAFFQLAGYHLLRECFPEAEIALIPEMPGYPSYWNRRGGNPSNYFDYVNQLKPDYLVLMGPVFRRALTVRRPCTACTPSTRTSVSSRS